MKKSILFLVTACFLYCIPASAQVGRFINKVTKSVANDVINKPDSEAKTAKQEPEPECACDDAQLIIDLGGKLQLMYSELSIDIRDDGTLLVKNRAGGELYIVNNGIPEGPVKPGDPRLAGFENTGASDGSEVKKPWANNEYISATGDKFTIKFNGKSYGPFSRINEFKVAGSKDKFAAIVVENEVVTDAEGKKMDEAIKNAKTDQEKMDLAMQYSQQMMQKMQKGGGPEGMMQKMITNIPGVNYDPLKSVGGVLNNKVKFDEILFTTNDKVIDLSNNVLVTLKPDSYGAEDIFLNTSNTKYAYYKYGTLTYDNGSTMSDLFNPHFIKTAGQVYLAYMYYSPKRNAIMQCKISF